MNVAKLAIEVWRSHGPRTVQRLNSICEDYATVYAQSANLPAIQEEALGMTRDWEVEPNGSAQS